MNPCVNINLSVSIRVFFNYNKALLFFCIYSMLFSCTHIHYSRNFSDIQLVNRILYYPVLVTVEHITEQLAHYVQGT